MRILLIGGGGFVGGALSRCLTARGHAVFCADRVQTRPDVLKMELDNRDSILRVLRQTSPERIFHLAAQSKITRSWESPEETMDVNLTGSLRLFMCAVEVVPQARFIFIGSGTEYGNFVPENGIWTEDSCCAPQNPYSISKYAAGMTLKRLAEKHTSDFVHLRPFNHYGPGQGEGFVIADFCAQIARAEKGLIKPEIRVGDLSAERDFLYIEDILNAYSLVAEKTELSRQVYNICSGKTFSISKILDVLIGQAQVNISVVVDQKRVRGSELAISLASSKAMQADVGWAPQVSLEYGLQKTLEYWRNRVLGES